MLTISEQEVKKILKELSTEKSAGVDTIPPKLVKLAVNYLAGPLPQFIDNNIKKEMFPENANVASVTPIDKKTDDKNSVLNFRPISILNCFSKVYENILKTQLVEKMNTLFSPFISAYRESYNTQHVLIRLIEVWRKNLDNNYFTKAVLMGLSKAFNCIPHDLVIAKLAAYGFDKNMICYIYSYLKSRKQCVSVNNIKSTFEEIISGVPQGSIVGPILFKHLFQ